ncbi:hypothetical protein IFM89_022592 [Coptis chinensis]|uniref:U-box domain-containing protein n=1 Tax=Coptis chinensis TaxID=261450 RepID=A0A835M1B0_9MAGN|nr:hypothetical protein IFM89_022592 [Coptis chinensis]
MTFCAGNVESVDAYAYLFAGPVFNDKDPFLNVNPSSRPLRRIVLFKHIEATILGDTVVVMLTLGNAGLAAVTEVAKRVWLKKPSFSDHIFKSPKPMKTHNAKIKNPPRPLFSCGIFSYCTQTVLSPTNSQTPTLPQPPSDPLPPSLPPPPPPPPQLTRPKSESASGSESSSSSTSQSFTQWRFPIPESPSLHCLPQQPESTSNIPKPPIPSMTLTELFHVAEIQLSAESYNSRLSSVHLLERSLVPNLPANGPENPTCPLAVMKGLVGLVKDIAGAKPATKVLLALCLFEPNRHVAVEAGAVNEVVEALAELEGAAAERALAGLELLCTVPEGAAEVRDHALGVPMMVQMMGKMNGRGKESAISVLSVIFSGGPGSREGVEPPDEVARAVALAMQGECSVRGRRKGAQLLKCLEIGRLDLSEVGHHGCA